jgi:putative transposase
MPGDPKRFNRRSVRLKENDYSSPGAYFVTIMTQDYKCIFGKILGKEMHTNDLGKIAQNCWKEITIHFQNVEVEPFVVMPNHIHGIINIYENDRRGTIYRAPTTEKFGKPVVGSIPTIIRTYKAAVSRRARQELGLGNIWQRNYYEHILRNPAELERTAAYILANPVYWAEGSENDQKS